MAFTLAFTVSQSGDAKTITITDATGTGATGWGGANPALTDIDNSANTLTLDITITTSDGTETSYDAIDVHDTFLTGGHTATTDLVYALNCSLITDSGVALGTSDDEFPDGLYEITYTWKKGLGGTETHTDSVTLIDGVVKASVYELLRNISIRYECEDYHERDLLDVIFIKGYYDCMIATAVVGREDQVIEQLLVLERLVANGSDNSW